VIVAFNALLIIIDFYLGEFNELNRTSILWVEIVFTTIFLIGKYLLLLLWKNNNLIWIFFKKKIELIFKVFTYGPRGYWTDLWNRFDFLIVAASSLDIVSARDWERKKNYFFIIIFLQYRLALALPNSAATGSKQVSRFLLLGIYLCFLRFRERKGKTIVFKIILFK